MLEHLERQTSLTNNQRKIVFAAILGDMLDFFDFYLIGFVLAFIVGSWKLTYGQSAMILLSSGLGAVPGALFWGWLADRIGRRKVFMMTALNFSLATGVMALTPEQGGWIFLTFFRFLVGFGVSGLFAVDLPLVQEFVPTSKRGLVGGIVTSCLPLGSMLGAFLGAYLAPIVGWRGLFVVGLMPALITLLIRAWVPESPRWLIRMGRVEEAREALAWALQTDPRSITLPTSVPAPRHTPWRELFRYPRSMILSTLTSLGVQTTGIGLVLWAPTLFLTDAVDRTGGSFVSHDMGWLRGTDRPLSVLVAVGSDRSAPFGCAAELRRGDLLLAGWRVSRRLHRWRLHAVPGDHAVALLRRWRLRGRWAIRCGGAAGGPARKRHGLRLRPR